MSGASRTVFITGAASGLGACTARHLADRGFSVLAADIAVDALNRVAEHRGITAVPVDVTSATSVEAARQRVSELCDGLDGVVNFAGVLTIGSLIEIDEATLERTIQINVLGTYRINKALFPLVHARKGRIVDVSSEQGWQTPMPFVGAYTLTKYAIEAYTDSLRRELMFLDVPVIKIQPGPFKTSMVAGIEERFTRLASESRYFGDLLTQLKHLTIKEQAKAHDPEILAAVIHRALTVHRPRPVYSVRPDLGRTLLSTLPPRVADPLLRVALGILSRLPPALGGPPRRA
ncbi:MAG: SDR family NAD(P)-dependent oxidoreductase [Deltaproteobacteria bacterium]|jgi:NAD(P)-dependent dehydrogenase (short-subunit alcohol dehydrogenase family)|nr:SDR family NAD(P)-dependent oxidoreductase [Deltaproteobacteria bacterium]